MSNRIFDAIRDAWCTETAYSHGSSGAHRFPNGQCAVTALLVQSIWGGHIIRGQAADRGSHYWNSIPMMGEIDLTRAQFPADTVITRGHIVDRETLLADQSTSDRYAKLVVRFNAAMIGDRNTR